MTIEYLMHSYPGFTSRRTAECVDLLRELWPCHDGPAHIVLADFNLTDPDIEWCMTACDEGEYSSEDLPPAHPRFAATKAVLGVLMSIPEEERQGTGSP